MEFKPGSLVITRWLVILTCLLWAGFGLIAALGLHPALPEGPLYRFGMALPAWLASLILAVLYVLLSRGSRFAYYALIAAIFLLAVLTIMDEFGLADLLYLLLDLALFLLLLKDKRIYLEG